MARSIPPGPVARAQEPWQRAGIGRVRQPPSLRRRPRSWAGTGPRPDWGGDQGPHRRRPDLRGDERPTDCRSRPARARLVAFFTDAPFPCNPRDQGWQGRWGGPRAVSLQPQGRPRPALRHMWAGLDLPILKAKVDSLSRRGAATNASHHWAPPCTLTLNVASAECR